MSATENLRNKKTLGQNLISIALLCLIILGIALRFYDLAAESYWLDEIWTVHLVQRDLGPILARVQVGFPPAYLVIAHFWVQVLGTTEAATRALSALIGVVSIPLMYVVGCELFSSKVGLLSALLMAISEFQIHYSQEFRFYSLFVVMTLFSFLLYVRALRTRRLSHLVLYVVASILLFYTHAFGVFILAAENLYFLLRWNRHRELTTQWLLGQALILLALGPGLLPGLARTLTAGSAGALGWVPDDPLWLPLRTLYWYVFPLRHERSWTAVGVSFATGIAFLVIGTGVFAAWKGRTRWIASVRELAPEGKALLNRTDELVLVGCWLVCPVALPFVLSRVLGPMYVHRYTISAAPALYLLLALAITTIREVVPEFVVLGALAIMIVPGLRHYYVTDVKEQWREVAAYVEENAREGDVIVFVPAEGGWLGKAFYWYYRGSLPGCDIGTEFKTDEAIANALAGCISGRERFWLVVRGNPERIGHLVDFFLNRDHNAIRLIGEQKFAQISLYLFEHDQDAWSRSRARIVASRHWPLHFTGDVLSRTEIHLGRVSMADSEVELRVFQ